jgi:hypothetical protein
MRTTGLSGAPQRTPVPTTSGTVPAEWSRYGNSALGFELWLPPGAQVWREFNDQHNRLVYFKSADLYFEVRLKDGTGVPLDQHFYLDLTPSGGSLLDGRPALVFKAPHGYCDGPSCGAPFLAYAAKNGETFYDVVFHGDTELDLVEEQVLASFRFTAP